MTNPPITMTPSSWLLRRVLKLVWLVFGLGSCTALASLRPSSTGCAGVIASLDRFCHRIVLADDRDPHSNWVLVAWNQQTRFLPTPQRPGHRALSVPGGSSQAGEHIRVALSERLVMQQRDRAQSSVGRGWMRGCV